MLFNPVDVRKINPHLNTIINSQSNAFFEFSISREAFLSLDFYTDNLLELLDVNPDKMDQIDTFFLEERMHPLDVNYFIHSVL